MSNNQLKPKPVNQLLDKQILLNIINDALIFEEIGEAISIITGEFPSKRMFNGVQTYYTLLGIENAHLVEELNDLYFSKYVPMIKDQTDDFRELSNIIHQDFYERIVACKSESKMSIMNKG